MPLSPEEIDAIDLAPKPAERAAPNLSPQSIDALPEPPRAPALSAKEIDATVPAVRLRALPFSNEPPQLTQLPNRQALNEPPPPEKMEGFNIAAKEKPLEQIPWYKLLYKVPWSEMPGVQFSQDTVRNLMSLPAQWAARYQEEHPDVTEPAEGGGVKEVGAYPHPVLDKLVESVPGDTTVERVTGIQHSIAKTADYILSPLGVVAPGIISKLPGLAQRLIVGALGTLMLKNAADKGVELYQELNNPKPDQTKVGELATDILTDTGFGILSAYGATRNAANEPLVKDFLTKRSVEEFVEKYGKAELRAMFDRVQSGQGTPEETAYYNWVTTGTVKGPTMEPTSEASVATTKTVTTPTDEVAKWPNWLKNYLGVKPYEQNILLTRAAGKSFRPRAYPQLTAPQIDEIPPTPAPAQPAGGPNAPQVQSPVAEIRGDQTGVVPPVAGGKPSELPGPTGATTPKTEGEGGFGPVIQPEQKPAAPTNTGPQVTIPGKGQPQPPVPQPAGTPTTTTPPAAPTLPTNHTAIIIRRPDGSEYPAAFGGYWTQLPGVPPMISRWDPSIQRWTSGFLQPGESIIAGDLPPKPPQVPFPPKPKSEGVTEPNPTPEQIESGKYPKRVLSVHGLEIHIENEKGGIRRSKPGSQPKWEVTMPAAYGYINTHKDNTGEKVDVYVGDHPMSTQVFVVDQINPHTKKFDEPKVMLGFKSGEEAMDTYVKAFTDGLGMQRIGAVTAMNIDEFKQWLEKGGAKGATAYGKETPPEPKPETPEKGTSGTEGRPPIPSGPGPSGGPVAEPTGGTPPVQPPPAVPGSAGGTNVETPAGNEGQEPQPPAGAGGRGKSPGVRRPAKPGVQSGQTEAPKPEQPQTPEPVPTGEQPPAPAPAGKPKSTDPNAVNHVIKEGDVIAPKGRVGKMEANIKAIEILKQLEAQNRNATPDEKAALAQYTGWGSLSQVFDTRKYWDDKWQKDWGVYQDKLKELLTEDEWDMAARSTQYAHFTSGTVIGKMWDAARVLGFTGGRVLEPAGGIGHFNGLQPRDLADVSDWLMIDMDNISARIMTKLYPESKVINQPFGNVPIPPGSIDLAITNVPFSANTVEDPNYPVRLNLHNWFIAHMLDVVKPGGMVITITTGHTMDSNAAMREFLASRGELMAAIRLPNTAFKENAGTEVTTDILFLRKPMTPQPEFGEDWAMMKPTETYDKKPIDINEYFVNHPDMVAGRLSLEGTMYGGEEFATLPFKDRELADVLKEIVAKLPKDVFGKTPSQFADFSSLEGAIGMRDGTMVVTDKGTLAVAMGGKFVDPVTINPIFKEAATIIQAKAYANLAGAYRALIAQQLDPQSTEGSIAATRSNLNTLYDAYVKKYNFLNARKTDIFEFENSYYLLLGLEKERITVNDKTGKLKKEYLKADVFHKRTQFPRLPPESASNTSDALQISLSFHGAIDPEYIGKLLGTDADSAIAALLNENLAFINPESQLPEAPEQYLSGNVRQKLRIAEQAAKDDPTYGRNVEALKGALPPTKPFRKIRVYLGSTWVPDNLITEFGQEVFDSKGYGGVKYIQGSDSWAVGGFDTTPKMTQTFGTDRRNGEEILASLLNQKTLKIYDTIDNPDGSQSRVFNQKATEQVRAVAEKLQNEFTNWLRRAEPRQQVIETTYNDKVNNYVVRTYNVARLDLPGANGEITLRTNQRNAVWRFVQERHGLLGHSVGSGKTYAQIAIAMECRRLGLAHKPMITVMNSTLGQFAIAFRNMYPSANILIATKADMEQDNRKAFLGRIAAGDYDAIIIPHSQFNMLPDDPAFEKQMIKKLIDELVLAINDAIKASKGAKKDPTVKQLEKLKEKYQQRLRELADRKKEDLATFQELGVDLLLVDEAHEFKKPPFVTKRDKIAGLSTEQSKRAFSLYMKSRYIQSRNNGRGVILSTGTPVTNTLGEAWHMLNLASPHVLKEFGVDTFDRFLSTFTLVASEFDVNAVGNLTLKDKLSRFVNLPELVKMVRSSWDILTQDDLRQILEAAGQMYPKLIGDKVQNVIVPRTAGVTKFMEFLTEVYDSYNELTGKEKRLYNYIPVLTFLAGKAAALDMRLVDRTAKDDPGSKINRAVEEAFKVWSETKEARLTQAIFLDQMNPFYKGISKLKEFANHEGITFEPEGEEETIKEDLFLYNDMRKKLIARGVPEKEILIVNEHDTKSPAAAAMFDRINTGEIRIVMGSTAKMGVGVNMQQRMKWLHHLDVPWFPALLEQRNGRIIRSGNMNPEVGISYYGMEKTSDVGLYAKNESKAKFMQQVLAGKITAEETEDPAGALILTMQEQMAALSGDPLLFEKVQLENRIRTLRLQREAFEDEQHSKRTSYGILQSRNESEANNIVRYQEILAWARTNLAVFEKQPIPEGEKEVKEEKEEKPIDALISNRKYTTRKQAIEAMQAVLNQHQSALQKNMDSGAYGKPYKSGYFDIKREEYQTLGTINGAVIKAYWNGKKVHVQNEKGGTDLMNVGELRRLVAFYPVTMSDVHADALPGADVMTPIGIIQGLGKVAGNLEGWIVNSKNTIQRQTAEMAEIENLLKATFAGAKELAESEARYAQLREAVESGAPAGQKAADMLFDLKVDWAPLLVRIRNQLERIIPQEEELRHQESVTTLEMRTPSPKGLPEDPKRFEKLQARLNKILDAAAPLTERIQTLKKRLAVVEKARLEAEFSGDAWLLPYGVTPATRPGISYSVQPGVDVPDRTPNYGTSTGEAIRAQGIEQIRHAVSDPATGLHPEVRDVILDLLDQPVMQSLDWSQLRLSIIGGQVGPAVEGGVVMGGSSVANWLIGIARDATPKTFPHEIFHFLYEMLPAADKERINELRLNALAKQHKIADGYPLTENLLKYLESTGMTSTEFLSMLEALRGMDKDAADWFQSLYPLINPGEFTASMGGEKFARESAKNRESWFEGLWTRVKAWLKGLVDAVMRQFRKQGKARDFEDIYNDILAGKEITTPEAGAQAERDIKLSVEKRENAARAKDATEGDASTGEPWGVPGDEWVRTQVMGEDWYVRAREALVSGPETIAYAKAVFDRVKLPATWDPVRKIWVFDRTGFDLQLEFRNLLEEMKKEIQSFREPGKPAGVIASLLDSVRRNMPLSNSAMADLPTPLRNDLYAMAQGEISQYGLNLGAFSRLKPEFNDVAQSVDVVLNKIFSDAFGGDQIRKLIEQVLLNFRDVFTEPEIAAAFKDKPGAEEFMKTLLALNMRDVGGRLYRRLQGTLVPKRPLTRQKLEKNAKLDEAYDSVIETLKREYGILPKERPGKKSLTPQERLALMVDEKTATAVGQAIGSAVEDAEYNAGRAAMIKAAEKEKDPDKKEELDDHLALMQETAMDRENRVQPLPEFVEIGLQMPEFKHWLSIREHIGYSPTSMKLVQDVIRGSFKGTKFATGKVKPADTRLDLDRLAKSPADEVTRALDAFFDNVAAVVELGDVGPETKARVMTAIEGQVIDQLNKAMARARDPMFREPKAGTSPTPEQRGLQLLNAGLFADPRLNIPEMVTRAAEKSAIQRLMPKVVDITKDIFQTPFYRQDELAERFADYLVSKLRVDPTQVAKAKELFIAAFNPRMAKARESAFKHAVDSLTPKERKAFRKRGIVEKLHRMLNAGGADPTALINEIARENGYEIPTPAVVQHMRELSEKEQKLRELTPADLADLGPNPSPEDLEKAKREKAVVTEGKRAAINRELAATWARLSRPIKWSKFWSTRKNIADAINEVEVADMLLKAGFALRLPTHIATQLFVHIPTRAIGFLVQRIADKEITADKAWSGLSQALMDGYRQTVAAIRPGLVAAGGALAGRNEQRNVDRLLSGIAAFDRIDLQAKELEAKGEHIRAGALRLFGLIKFSLRYVQACDAMQGTSVEFQDLAHLVESGLIEKGYTEAERLVLKDRILGGLGPKRDAALSQAAKTFANAGETYTDAELHERAWALVISNIYDQIKAAGLPADEFRQRIELLKRTAAWQERVTTGPGGLAAMVGRGASQLFRQAGLPLSFTRFANAIGTGINYSLMFTPLYATAAWRIGSGSEESSWFKTEEDVQQRRIQALLGTLFGALIAYLVWKGFLRVFVRPPANKNERELWEKAGHRAGTVEIVTGPDSFIPLSLVVGPASTMAPYLSGAQAALDLADRREKKHQKDIADAEARGLKPGPMDPVSPFDLLAVAADAAWGTLMGSKTFSGVAQSITENASLNVKKGIAAYVSPIIPGLPAYQEITRALGWLMDSKMASVWDYLVPLPTSSGRAINFLGEPVGTPDAIQRVIQTMSAGTYPWMVDSKQVKNLAAYDSLFASGYRPPAIDPNKGYAINGEWRPLNDTELDRYTLLRSENLRKELVDIGTTDDPKLVRQAFQTANQNALEAVGVDLLDSKAPPKTQPVERNLGQGTASVSGAPMNTPQTAPGRSYGGMRVSAGAGYRTLGRASAGSSRLPQATSSPHRPSQSRQGRPRSLGGRSGAFSGRQLGSGKRASIGPRALTQRHRPPTLRRR